MIFVTPDRPQKLMFNPTRSLVHSPVFQTLFFFGAHLPLALFMRASDWIGTIHALFVFAYGLNASLQKRSDKILLTLGYAAGAEVLWRMTSANIPWEFAKYSSVVIVVVALMMEGKGRQRGGKRPSRTIWLFVYLALLLPAVIIPISSAGLLQSRTDISFNLSGPLTLTFLGLYFWNRSFYKQDLIAVLLAIIAPIIGVWAIAINSTFTSEVTFILESNVVTSGGYGPNQVSNILGFGALASLILIIFLERMRVLKIVLFLVMSIFLIQSLLTFSRGGVYSFFFAALIFAAHIARTRYFRLRFFTVVFVVGLLGLMVVVPRLDSFTQGLWWQRFSSLESTGRWDLARADWQAFLENPISGLGVGGSKFYHQINLGDPRAAHTEYTRLLAEHGIFGILALVILIAIVWNRYWENQQGINRAIVATFSVWSLTIMGQSAMRFVAIPFCLALIFSIWQVEKNRNVLG